MPRRFTPAACGFGDIPELDAVFVDHNHHGHLSAPTVIELVGRFPDLHFLVGRGLAKWFCYSDIIVMMEMDRWEDSEVTLQKIPEPKVQPSWIIFHIRWCEVIPNLSI